MQPGSDRTPPGHRDTPLPPVRTQWKPLPAAPAEGVHPLAPFVPPARSVGSAPAAAVESMPWEEPPESHAAAAVEVPDESVDPWSDTAFETQREAPTDPHAFPVNAFILPEDAARIPAGREFSESLERQIAADVAARLEQLAGQLRESGFTSLLATSSDHQPVDVIIAAVLSGYLARKAR